MENKFYVYTHKRQDNGEVFYVGKGTGRRAWSSNGRSERWKSIADNFGFDVEIIHENLTQSEAFEIEVYEISKAKEKYELANIAKGGAGGTSAGYKHSDEVKQLISRTQKGRRKSEEHKEKLRIANTGKKLSDETRARMSNVRKKKGTNHLEGIPKTDEHKKKLSDSLLGKKKPQNKSGYVGVYYHSAAKKWAACITINGKAKHLGLFDTPEQASSAYQTEKSRKKMKGE